MEDVKNNAVSANVDMTILWRCILNDTSKLCFSIHSLTHILKSNGMHGISTADAFMNTHGMRWPVLWGFSRCNAIGTAAAWDWLFGVCEQVGGFSVCEFSSFLSSTGARIRAGGWAGCAPPERCPKLTNICWGVHHRNTDMVRITTKKQKTNDTVGIYGPHTGVIFVVVASLSLYIPSPWACIILSQESWPLRQCLTKLIVWNIAA